MYLSISYLNSGFCKIHAVQLRLSVGVAGVAEAAEDLQLLGLALGDLLGEEVIDLLAAQGLHDGIHFGLGAVALVVHGQLVENVVGNVAQSHVHDGLVVHTAVDHGGEVGEVGGVALQKIDGVLVGKGEELDQNTAGGTAGVVGVHKYAQGAEGGDLLALGVVGGDVLGDLAAGEGNRAAFGNLTAQVLDDGDHSVPHETAHVQLTAGLEGEIGGGMLHVAANVADPIADGDDAACGAVSLKGNGDGVGLLAQHAPHHGGHGQDAAQRGGGGGGGHVVFDGAVDHLGGTNDVDPRTAVLGHGAENGVVAHGISLSSKYNDFEFLFGQIKPTPSANGLLGLDGGAAYGTGEFLARGSGEFIGEFQSANKENAVAITVMKPLPGKTLLFEGDSNLLAVISLTCDLQHVHLCGAVACACPFEAFKLRGVDIVGHRGVEGFGQKNLVCAKGEEWDECRDQDGVALRLGQGALKGDHIDRKGGDHQDDPRQGRHQEAVVAPVTERDQFALHDGVEIRIHRLLRSLAQIPIAHFSRPRHHVPPVGGFGHRGEIEVGVQSAEVKARLVQGCTKLGLVVATLGLLLVGANVAAVLVLGKQGEVEPAKPAFGVVLILPAAEKRAAVLVLILQDVRIVSVGMGKLMGGVDVKHQKPAGGEVEVDATEAHQKVPVAAEIIEAVETADRGIHGAVQLEIPHILLQKEGRGVPCKLLHGGIRKLPVGVNAEACAGLLVEAVGALGVLVERLGEHVGAAVNADHIVPAVGQREGHAPRTAGQVQHDLRAGREEFFEAGFDERAPLLVVHVGVESVVSGRDGAVSVVHRVKVSLCIASVGHSSGRGSGTAAVGQSGMSCGLQLVEYLVVAVVSVLEATVDAADGGGAQSRLCGDVGVDRVGAQHAGGQHTAGHLLQLGDGAKVLKEVVAVLNGFEGQNGLKQKIQLFVLDRIGHGETPFGSGCPTLFRACLKNSSKLKSIIPYISLDVNRKIQICTAIFAQTWPSAQKRPSPRIGGNPVFSKMVLGEAGYWFWFLPARLFS